MYYSDGKVVEDAEMVKGDKSKGQDENKMYYSDGTLAAEPTESENDHHEEHNDDKH